MISLTKMQIEYLKNSTHRWNFKSGAVRSGKSFVDTAAVIPQRIIERKNKPGLSVIIGVSRGTVERNVLQPMREIYGTKRIGNIVTSKNTAMIFGEEVYCLGAEKVSQVAKIQGASFKYCYGDEIAKWNREVFTMLQSRLDKAYSCFDGSCNPEYPTHWLKQFLDSDADIYLQKYRIFDNPFLPKEYVDALCQEYAGTVYEKRYIYGEWALAEGLIYPMYEQALKDVPEYEEDDVPDYCLSVDYGTLNAFAALLWERHGAVWYASRGYYYSGRETGVQKTDEEYAAAIDALTEDLELPALYGAPRKLEVIVDPSAASFITLMQKRGRYKVRKADNDVLDGIRETATAMQTGRIKISPHLRDWINEAGGYVWDNSEGVEKPVKINDHCLIGETLVNTKDGSKPISELVGTSGEVWSYNTETGVAELKPYHDCRLTQKQAEIYEIETEDGRFIRCTGEHPILTERGYVLTKDLTASDRIIDIMISSVGIKAIRKVGKADVYNMEVDGNHNFSIEGGLIVHNCMDATRYFVRTRRIARAQNRYQSYLLGGAS